MKRIEYSLFREKKIIYYSEFENENEKQKREHVASGGPRAAPERKIPGDLRSERQWSPPVPQIVKKDTKCNIYLNKERREVRRRTSVRARGEKIVPKREWC